MEALRTLEAWDASSREERLHVVEAIQRHLQPAVAFVGWERHALGDQAHDMAVFVRGERRWALLPGYVGELGYDPARHRLPEQLLRAWQEFMEDWREYSGPEDTFEAFLDRCLTPLRRVTLAPFLIEMIAAPLAPRTYRYGGLGEEIGYAPKYADLLAELLGQGLRYPTADEWEYACSGGSRAFFRWGDDLPSIACTPAELRAADGWRQDLLPNAFGLLIGIDCQQLEFCMEPGEVRGGDSGSASNLLKPYLDWFGYATSHRLRLEHPDAWYDPYLRRVVPLDGVL